MRKYIKCLQTFRENVSYKVFGMHSNIGGTEVM